jgi:hypothetical protein
VRPKTPEQIALVQAARDEIKQLAANIEALALNLTLDESCAVMQACGTIRCAAHGYVMKLVKTDAA